MSDQEPTSVQPGMVGAKRYPRTFNGLIASMVVLVAAVVSCSVLQNANHQTISTMGCSAQSAWQTAVQAAQSQGVMVDYPGVVPSGWMVSYANFDTEQFDGGTMKPRWRITIKTTDCNHFVELVEEPVSESYLEALVGTNEVHRLLDRPNLWTPLGSTLGALPPGKALVRSDSMGSLDQFVASLTTAKLPKN